MKLYIFALLGLAACSKPPKVPSPTVLATADDCNRIYDHILTVKVAEIDPKHELDSRNQEGARILLDQHYQMIGLTEKFFSSCTDHFTIGQVSCMLKEGSVHNIFGCVLSKNNP